MHPILTITLNPALDIATSVGHVEPGVKLRCSAPQIDPGGGGINVARAIHQLGGHVRAFVALGGETGERMERRLRDGGLDPVVHPAPGETRQSLAVTDLGLNDQFRFMLPGPVWTRANVDAAVAAIVAVAPSDGFVVLSGSGPSGAQPDLYARICADLHATGTRLIVDTSGPALAYLARGQDAHPLVLRMDQEEAEGLALRALPHRADSAAFAADLVARGAAEIVIVARGAEGSVLVTHDRQVYVAAAKVRLISKVGAGDTFVGAFTRALAMDLSLDEALSHGSAAASAAVMTEGTELCRAEDFAALLPQCAVAPI